MRTAQAPVSYKIYSQAITKYKLVMIDTSYDNAVLHPTAQNAICVGVAADNYAATHTEAAVRPLHGGPIKAMVGAAVTRGERLIADSAGRVIPLPGTTGTYNVVGVATTTQATTNGLVQFQPGAQSVEV